MGGGGGCGRWVHGTSAVLADHGTCGPVPTAMACMQASYNGHAVGRAACKLPVRWFVPLRLCRGRPCSCGPNGCDGGLHVSAGGFACTACSVGHGCMRPGSTEAYADGVRRWAWPTSQIAFLGDEGVQVSWDVERFGHVRFDAARDSRPTRFLSRRDLSLEADEHSGPAGRDVVSDAGSCAGHAADRCLPGSLADSGSVHGRRLRPGGERQLCDQGDLPARSGVPRARAGRRGNARQHAARSGCRPDCRSRSSRFDPGDPAHG